MISRTYFLYAERFDQHAHLRGWSESVRTVRSWLPMQEVVIQGFHDDLKKEFPDQICVVKRFNKV